MIELIMIWIIGLLWGMTIMAMWFDTTSFAPAVCKVLKKLGWKRHDPDWWPPEENMEPEWFLTDWEFWVDANWGSTGTLLRCPVCFSVRMYITVACIVWITAGPALSLAISETLWGVLISVLTWPGVANRLRR